MSTPTADEIHEATRNLRRLRTEGKLPPGPLIVTRGCAFHEHPDGTWHLCATGVGRRMPPPGE